MDARGAQIRWWRVLIAGVGAAILTSLHIFVVVLVYATTLAVQARGAPDTAQIGRVAGTLGTWLAPPLAVFLTLVAAAWVARGARSRPQLNGTLVGVVSAVVGLALAVAGARGFQIGAWLTFVLLLAAGWLGGRLGRRGLSTS